MYLVIDKELTNEEPIVYGLFTTEAKANETKNHIIDLAAEEVFAVDPKESGVDREYDEHWVRKQIADTVAIVEIKEFDKILFKEE
jgi:hypothetical protein